MQANAVLKVNALTNIIVAALAATFIAVGEIKWSSIVASRDHTLVLRDHRSIATFHAIGA